MSSTRTVFHVTLKRSRIHLPKRLQNRQKRDKSPKQQQQQQPLPKSKTVALNPNLLTLVQELPSDEPHPVDLRNLQSYVDLICLHSTTQAQLRDNVIAHQTRVQAVGQLVGSLVWNARYRTYISQTVLFPKLASNFWQVNELEQFFLLEGTNIFAGELGTAEETKYLSDFVRTRQSIIRAGFPAIIAELIAKPETTMKLVACAACLMMKLCREDGLKEFFTSKNLLPRLYSLLAEPCKEREHILRGIYPLIQDPGNMQIAYNAGILPIYISLLSSPVYDEQSQAAMGLETLARNGGFFPQMLAFGSPQALIQQIANDQNHHRARSNASVAVAVMARNNPACLNALLANPSLLPGVISLLRSNLEEARVNGLGCLGELAAAHYPARQAMAQAGVVPLATELLLRESAASNNAAALLSQLQEVPELTSMMNTILLEKRREIAAGCPSCSGIL